MPAESWPWLAGRSIAAKSVNTLARRRSSAAWEILTSPMPGAPHVALRRSARARRPFRARCPLIARRTLPPLRSCPRYSRLHKAAVEKELRHIEDVVLMPARHVTCTCARTESAPFIRPPPPAAARRHRDGDRPSACGRNLRSRAAESGWPVQQRRRAGISRRSSARHPGRRRPPRRLRAGRRSERRPMRTRRACGPWLCTPRRSGGCCQILAGPAAAAGRPA